MCQAVLLMAFVIPLSTAATSIAVGGGVILNLPELAAQLKEG